MLSHDDVMTSLATVIDPELGRPITELGMVDSVRIDGARVAVRILLTTPACPLGGTVEARVRGALSRLDGAGEVAVSLGAMDDEQRAALRDQLRGHSGENPFAKPDSSTLVLAVSSGKGGVGKSTIAANLAAQLAASGLRVGLVDADIYGFSLPRLMGVTQRPVAIDSMIVPPIAHGVKVMSIGMFLRGNAPVMWRGPMLHRALEQFFADVFWDELDVLLLDLPPGTGDIALSIAQLVPGSRILVVTTPQEAAAAVAERAGAIGHQTGQRVVGVVENMSYLAMPDGTRAEIFGSGGGERAAAAISRDVGYDVPLLAHIPLEPAVGASSDAGEPIVLSASESPAAQALRSLGTTIAGLVPARGE